MSVREVFDAAGNFEVTLVADTPPDLLKAIDELDHLVIHSQGDQMFGLDTFTDAALLSEARYAGPIMEPEFRKDGEPYTLRGHGMNWHWGDPEANRGPIFAEVRTIGSASLSTYMDDFADGGIIPAALTQGTITNTAANKDAGTFYPADISMEALRTTMETFDAHYRTNPDGTVDAGPTSSNEVYLVNEDDGGRLAVAIPRNWGPDAQRVSLELIDLVLKKNASEWVSRTAIVDEAYDGSNTISSFKDRASNPYYDIRNNELRRTLRLSRPSSDADLSTDEFLNRQLELWNTIQELNIDFAQWEVSDGSVAVGDWIYVYNPLAGVFDADNEIEHRGMFIYPQRIRIQEADWPLTKGMGIYVRPGGSSVTAADWLDLTPYVEWERYP